MVVPSLASPLLRAAFLLLLVPSFPGASAEDLPTSSVEQEAGQMQDEATRAVQDASDDFLCGVPPWHCEPVGSQSPFVHDDCLC